MKKYMLFILLVLNLGTYSQIKYEQGYFITNANEKITCLIRNNDWMNNPSKFQYKMPGQQDELIAELKDVKEFGVFNSFKYKRYTVDIDYSTENVATMKDDPMPQFNKEELFLKTIIEGKTSLFSFEGKNVIRYFLSVNDAVPVQLIYKKYLSAGNELAENTSFRKQLQDNLLCEQLSYTDFENLSYKEKDLKAVIITNNNCGTSSGLIVYNKADKKKSFSLSIKPGLNVSSLTITSFPSSIKSSFGTKACPRIGLEAEFTLPFNKNTWAMVIEPVYHNFKSTITDKQRANFQVLDLNFGIRHLFFINTKSKIYLSGILNFYFPFNSTIIFNSNYFYKKSGRNLILGVGYKYNRYSFELKAGSSREILANYANFRTGHQVISIVAGLNLF